MGSKCFFWKGVRVLGSLMSWKPIPKPRGSNEQTGVSRLKGRISARSPNFIYDIVTKTSLRPQTTMVLGGSKDIGPQGVMNLKYTQWLKTIMSLAFGNTPLGDLSWCEDNAEICTLASAANPGVFPGVLNVVIDGGGGFTPAVGMYVLVRDPSSGDGFVCKIQSVAGGGVNLALLEAPRAIDDTWEIVHVRFFYPNTAFAGVDGYDTATQTDDKWIPELTTAFKSADDVVYPTYYLQDLDS